MKKEYIITAVVLMTAGLALFVGALFASDFDFSKLDISKYETNTYTVSADFDKIEINTEETDIVWIPSEDDGVKVVCIEKEKIRHSVSVENGTLKISEKDTRKWYDHIGMFSKSLSMTVYLPSDRLEYAIINSNTGDVSIPASFSLGTADITSSTGDTVFEASVDGLLKIKASTGDIKLSGINAGEINLSVSTGDIAIKSLVCKETASISVSTGDTIITDMTCGNLTTTGSTGSITLKNAVATGGFSIKRRTGDVKFENCDAEQIIVQTSTGDVTGTLRTAKIFLPRTSTGSIHVPDTFSGGQCEITTSTGDIDIRLK